MAFKQGQSGNPGGRPQDKPWRDALRIAAFEKDGKGRPKLRAIAEKTVALALEGDIQAIMEVANRLDGRPVQAIEANNEITHYVIAIPAPIEGDEIWAEAAQRSLTRQ